MKNRSENPAVDVARSCAVIRDLCPALLLAYLLGRTDDHPESGQRCRPDFAIRMHAECTLCQRKSS